MNDSVLQRRLERVALGEPPRVVDLFVGAGGPQAAKWVPSLS